MTIHRLETLYAGDGFADDFYYCACGQWSERIPPAAEGPLSAYNGFAAHIEALSQTVKAPKWDDDWKPDPDAFPGVQRGHYVPFEIVSNEADRTIPEPPALTPEDLEDWVEVIGAVIRAGGFTIEGRV